MEGKMIHLRVSEQLHSEAETLISEFGFKSIQEFINEAIRKAVEQYQLKRDIKKLRQLIGSCKNIKRRSQKEMEQHALSTTVEQYAKVAKEFGF